MQNEEAEHFYVTPLEHFPQHVVVSVVGVDVVVAADVVGARLCDRGDQGWPGQECGRKGDLNTL